MTWTKKKKSHLLQTDMKEHKRQKDINESHSKKNEDKQREAPRDTKQPPGDLKCFEATQPPNQKKTKQKRGAQADAK